MIAVLAVILFFGGSLNVNAQNLIDLEYNSLSFLNSNRTVLVNNGSNGFSQGSVHRYNNLITKNGVTVYAYGGDFGAKNYVNDENFCCSGLI